MKALMGKTLTGLLFAAVLAGSPADGPPEISWQDWSDAAFRTARAQKRLVLLDLGAVWCHWCHVMEETTYRDPKVVELLGKHFVAIRVDQDARPDLSNRYEDYGWPATVIFDGTGRELVKFAGYIPPERMRSLLEAVVADPTPGPSALADASMPSAGAALTPQVRQRLSTLLFQRYDREVGGWGFAKKFLDFDDVEYCLVRARSGDADAERMAKETLARSRKLIDPVWGGLYQYSDSGDWDHPHFEKLLQFQAEGIRVYSQAYAMWRDPADLQAARDIHRYVRAFLKSPEGAFYVSQDADLVAGEHSAPYYAQDDAGRRKRGVPRVDTHLYARESAWMANALVMLYAVTAEPQILEEASVAAGWVLANRALPGGGFRHDSADAAGPYLGDTVACGRAFLSLWAVTGDRAWLARAREAAALHREDLRRRRHARPRVGRAAEPVCASAAAARRERDGGSPRQTCSIAIRETRRTAALASQAMAYLAIPEVAERFPTASVLLVDLELSSEPPHVTVVGARQDAAARTLLGVAWADLVAYRRVELWDRRDGALPNLDVEFPQLDRTAAFVCAAGRCSLPAFTPEDLQKRIARLRTPAVTP